MNYLFINGRFPQYSQTFVHDQIKAIKAEGASSVTVYARSLAPFRFENSVPECAKQLLYGKPFNSKVAKRVAISSLLHPLRAMKIAQLFKRKKISYSTLMLGLQLREAPDVTVTHFGNNFENGLELKKYLFPTMKNVVVFHGHDVSSYIKEHGWDNYRSASPYINSAICVNKIWAQAIKDNTTIRDVRTVYLGTGYYPLARRPNGDTSAFSILFVGRFVDKKGFDLLYRAVKNVRVTMRQRFRVHCIGDGPRFNEFKKKAVGEGLGETFVFYGSKQKSFVQQLMRECDLLVAPSRVAEDGDSEGLPVVLMEAMMAGIPVVSTFHSGIPELIQDRVTGLLVPESDVEKLEEAIAFALRNPNELRAMSERAHEHVKQHHNEVAQVQQFTSVLREIA